jgi:hypothetical protein
LPSLPLAFDPAGIGDTLTGAVLVVLAVLLGFVVLLIWTWVTEQRSGRDYNDPGGYDHIRPVTRGVLICDWVDMTVLTTVAKQKEIAPEPVRRERGEGRTTSRGVHLGARRIAGRFGRERRQEVTEVYELAQDPNALLVKVLGKLSEDGLLQTDLEETIGSGVFSGETLDEMIRAAKDTPELEAAREAVLQLQANSARAHLLERWRYRAQSPRFALVESVWRATAMPGTDAEILLQLSKLREHEYAPGPRYGNPPEVATAVDMPPRLAMRATIATERLTEQGESRLESGTEIRAGIFCTTASVDEAQGSFTLIPIAVFHRVES